MFWFLYPPDELRELRPTETLRYGIYWNLIFLALGEILVFILGGLNDFGETWKLMYVAAAFLIPGLFFFGGIHTIEVGSKAVPLLFDKRMNNYILTEGLHWILPNPLMNIKKLDLRKRIVSASNTDTTADNVRVKADASIEWTVQDMIKYLDVSESVVQEGFVKLIQNVLRVSIREKSSQDILGAYDHVRNSIETTAQAKADSWGIGVEDVFVSSIDFVSEDVAKDHERKRREQVQAEGDKEEADRSRERIREIRDDLEVSSEKAIEFFQTEREKVKKEIKEYKITGISDQVVDALARRILGSGENK